MHGRKAGLNRLSTGVGKRQERTTPRRAWAKGSNEPPIDGRGRGVLKKQPPIDEAWAKGRNEPPLNEGVGVLFLKKSTAHQRGVVEVSTATRRGRGRGVFKKINRPSTRRGQRVGTNHPSTRAWVCCFKKYKLEFRFPNNNNDKNNCVSLCCF